MPVINLVRTHHPASCGRLKSLSTRCPNMYHRSSDLPISANLQMVDVTGQHSAGFGTAGYEWIQILGLHIAATLVPAKTSSDRLRSASSVSCTHTYQAWFITTSIPQATRSTGYPVSTGDPPREPIELVKRKWREAVYESS
jgi:hypothetical protein